MRRSVLRLVVLSALLVVVAALGYQPARAAGVVTNCSSPADFYSKLGGGGSITFNCPYPGPTVITIGQIVPAANTTIDGSNNGHPITLSGGNANRLFDQWATGGTLTLMHLTLRDGYAAASFGGCLLNEGVATLIDVTVTHCIADVYGGGIYSSGDAFTLADSRVISNTAHGGGGLSAGNAVTITNSLVADNRSIGTVTFDGGGGMYLGGRVQIKSTRVVNNHAVKEGGGLYVQTGDTRLNGVTFSGNVAEYAGGGIRVDTHAVLTLTNSTLSGNIAAKDYSPGSCSCGFGGGIMNGNYITLSTVTLNGNVAGDGGGLYDDVNATSAIMFNVSFINNWSAFDGGGYYNAAGSLFAINSTFSGNTALRDGGAAFSTNGASGASRLEQVTLSGNHAERYGGGIYSNAFLAIHDAELKGNTALASGGGLYNLAAVDLFNATLDGNSASVGGGGIYLANGLADLINVTLSGNRATNWGGGLEAVSGHADLLNVTISGNSAGSGGGVHVVSADVLLTNTVLAFSPTGGNCAGPPLTLSHFSLSGDFTCNMNAWPARPNPNGIDPLLTALGNYGGMYPVHMPKSGSPVIDGVSGALGPLYDERGVSRPQGLGYDIGAVERRSSDSDLAPRLFLPLLRR